MTKIIVGLIMILGLSSLSNAQKKPKMITLKGTVTDSLNRAIPNANIYIDGVNTFKTSNPYGYYKVKAKPDMKKILVFTEAHGGVEYDYKGESTIHFVLALPGRGNYAVIPRAEEMVDMGYTSQKKGSTTGSVDQINMDDKKDRNYRTIYEYIEGEVPGVLVQGSSITIRGPSSINASNQALLVVDGSPVPTISHINPNDVASVSVLKGAAASIYGTRGANGVILIKLKTGRDR